MELLSYLPVDYLLVNFDGGFLFYPKIDQNIRVNVDDSIQYDNHAKIYFDDAIYFSLCGLCKTQSQVAAIFAS